jgi:hypothetical protein
MFDRELITGFLFRRPAVREPAFVVLAAAVLLTLGVPVRAGPWPAPVPSRSGGAER